MPEDARLHEDLHLDSMERIEAGMQLEDEFGIALSDDEIDQQCMSTVGGVADYLMTQRGVE
jgi:acyl carrier protein